MTKQKMDGSTDNKGGRVIKVGPEMKVDGLTEMKISTKRKGDGSTQVKVDGGSTKVDGSMNKDKDEGVNEGGGATTTKLGRSTKVVD